jgi:probable HAF family extracellular repeat protein
VFPLPGANTPPSDSHRRTGVRVTLLDPLPGHATAWGFAINEAGHVAGYSAKDDQGQDPRAFIYRDGTMQDLGPAHDVRDVTTPT